MYWTLDRNFVYVARDTNVVLDELDDDSTKIVGMATLVLVPKFAGLVAQIEDVCVDKEYRGKGIARLLMHAVMSTARERKVTHIDLTSSPSREAALALYESLQFERRETIPLRFTMGSAQ
jgi:ribosomal protein S18 acetylase RimI-like enzyme